MSEEEKLVMFKKGGLRESFDVGIYYLTQLEKTILPKAEQFPGVVEKIQEKLKLLQGIKGRNLTVLKHLGVLEDDGKISIAFEGENPDGKYFLFEDFCFIKIEDDTCLTKVAKYLGASSYVNVENGKVTSRRVE
jgi:hypothetical protein